MANKYFFYQFLVLLFQRYILGIIRAVFSSDRQFTRKKTSIVITLSQTTNLDPSKLKEFADENFKFDKNGRKYSKWVENTVGKREIAFKRRLLQTCKNQGLFGKGLTLVLSASKYFVTSSPEHNMLRVSYCD